MQAYWFPIHTAILFFPLIAFLLAIPYALFSYHRYGAVSRLRTLVLASFIFYMLCAYFLVILPLPDPAAVADRQGPFMQLVPFNFMRKFLTRTVLRPTDLSTYLPALKQSVFYEPAFNLLLTVPFGAYMAYYFKRSLWQTALLALLLSLFFELTQLSGLYGIYPKPYRLFDVDDLLINTLGGMLGFGLGRVLARFLPSKKRLDRASLHRSEQVSYPRRLAACCMDVPLVLIAGSLLTFLTPLPAFWAMLAAYLLYFAGLQTALKGQTLGKRLVHIRVVSTGMGSLSWHLLVKYALLFAPVLLVEGLLSLSVGGISWLAGLLAFGLGFLLMGYAVVDWAGSFRRDRRLWYERLSGTRNISDLVVPAQDA